jgi:hypothetical protein
MNELPEHKQIAASLKLAKEIRIRLQAEIFRNQQPGQRLIFVDSETEPYQRARDEELELCSQLAHLRWKAQNELGQMIQERPRGKWDERRAQQLNAVITEIGTDLSNI